MILNKPNAKFTFNIEKEYLKFKDRVLSMQDFLVSLVLVGITNLALSTKGSLRVRNSKLCFGWLVSFITSTIKSNEI